MGDESDDYRDEDGEPLMDVDEEIQSDLDEPQQHHLDDIDDSLYDSHERSPDPSYIDSKGKLQKRLIIKSPRKDKAKLQKRLTIKSPRKDSSPMDLGFNGDDGDDSKDDDMAEWIRHYYSDDSDGGKRKREEWAEKFAEKMRKGEKGEKKFKTRRSGGGEMRDHDEDAEMKEMWDTIPGGNSKDDQEGFRTMDDDNLIYDSDVDPDDSDGSDNEHSPIYTPEDDQEGFRSVDDDSFTDDSDVDPDDSYGSGNEQSESPINTSEDDQECFRTVDDDNFMDDSDVDPDDSYGSGNEHSPIYTPEAEEGEEDEEIKELFEMGKNQKKNEKGAAETASLVGNIMAELKVVAEEDAELYRQGKPAINKLKKLSLLTDVLSKQQLHQEFLDHGGLTLLKHWLEPLPDGSLPDINIRAAVLKILNDFPIDLQHSDRRGLLKRSGLGKVIMFLSMSAEETTANQKLAKELVDKWSQPVYDNSTRIEDMKNVEDEKSFRRPPDKEVTGKGTTMAAPDDDLD
ncbi:protein IWS1 homolog 1 [Sesamum indicum]|uniref:Protein IWS1 homolog 1 n=1 Tax=Sesamum indicum TaxID=4182 RepID=A0A6I9SWQ4_SESIN|nr:protein IWS1 homolog 1 [Sesamum indicum]